MEKITQEMVDTGYVFIDVYGMKAEGDNDTIAHESDVEFYDILLRPYYWEDNDGESYGEWKNLTFSEACNKVEELEEIYSGIDIKWIYED